MTVWRLGSVPFLNERPLTHGLDARDDVAMLRLPPGPLADKLVAGELDAALIPVAEQLRHGLRSLGDLGIACRGPVESVRVWHEGPTRRLDRIQVPAHSRSSVMLLRLLLPHWGCTDAELVPTDYPAGLSQPPEEPALVIGDAALRCLSAGRPSTDLGAAWHDWTGLPFVFARWAARPGLDVGPSRPVDRWSVEEMAEHTDSAAIQTVLQLAYAGGIGQLGEIAASEGPARGIPSELARMYLEKGIVYTLGAPEEAGQAEFERRARDAGLLEAV